MATLFAIGALLIAPAVWSGYSTLYGSNGSLPLAGPRVANADGGSGRPGCGPGGSGGAGAFGGAGGFGGAGSNTSAALISYLESNRGSATYLVATTNSNTAALIILASNGQPVMSLGGFTGSDPIVTVDQFARLVESGQLRYVLAGRGGGGGGPQGGGSSSIISWVQANGTLVSSSAIGDASGSQTQLYDLSGLQRATA